MTCAEYLSVAAADVDGVLEASLRRAVDAHVESCARCRAVRLAQQHAKAVLSSYRAHGVPAPNLRMRVLSALQEHAARRDRRVVLRLLLDGALAAGLVLLVRPLWRTEEPDLLAVLIADARSAAAQQTPLAVYTDDVDALRRYYRTTGRVDFERSVDDFSAVGMRLVGGTIAPLGRNETTFSVYDGHGGRMVCRRFRAGRVRLPEGGEVIGNARIFTVDGVTICVLHLDHDVICVLASTLSRELFVQFLRTQHT
jgi:hypothetical protein